MKRIGLSLTALVIGGGLAGPGRGDDRGRSHQRALPHGGREQ